MGAEPLHTLSISVKVHQLADGLSVEVAPQVLGFQEVLLTTQPASGPPCSVKYSDVRQQAWRVLGWVVQVPGPGMPLV
jgi:hypothetical protein